MLKCYLCNDKINEKNSSVEHIILNAIGGRLKSKELLCKKCNSKLGEKPDAELAKQLNFYSVMLMIKRDRGECPPERMKSETDEYYINNGIPLLTKPKIWKEINGDNTNIKIEARTEEEAKRILSGFKKKDKDMNIETIFANRVVKNTILTEPLKTELVLGGKQVFPSILKTAINYYILKTRDIDSIKKAINNLKNNNIDLVEPISLENKIYHLEKDQVTHSIFFCGNKHTNKLYCIIDFFNITQYVVKLSDNYQKNIEELYVFDIIKRKEVKKDIIFTYLPSFIFSKKFNFDLSTFKVNNERFMGIAINRMNELKEEDNYNLLVKEVISKNNNLSERTVEKVINEIRRKKGNYSNIISQNNITRKELYEVLIILVEILNDND